MMNFYLPKYSICKYMVCWNSIDCVLQLVQFAVDSNARAWKEIQLFLADFGVELSEYQWSFTMKFQYTQRLKQRLLKRIFLSIRFNALTLWLVKVSNVVCLVLLLFIDVLCTNNEDHVKVQQQQLSCCY